LTFVCAVLGFTLDALPLADAAEPVFRAGAAAVDITPQRIPKPFVAVFDHVHARALVLDDGQERVALVVVENVGLPRDLVDRAKELAREKTGLRPDRILIASTHNHSAPSLWDPKGVEDYSEWLPGKLAESIQQALTHLEPARIGWTVVQDWEHTHSRRWVNRPDKLMKGPFGVMERANDPSPGFQYPDSIAPLGPSDPDLPIVAVQSLDGRPIALLANYAMHYYHSSPSPEGTLLISADFTGAFADKLSLLVRVGVDRGFNELLGDPLLDLPPERCHAWGRETGADPAPAFWALERFEPQCLAVMHPEQNVPAFVGIMSQGTSGDQMWPDWSKPAPVPNLDGYAEAIAQEVYAAYRRIQYRDWAPLKMAETEITVDGPWVSDQQYRRARERVAAARGAPGNSNAASSVSPDEELLEQIVAPRRVVELREHPIKRTIKLQALRIAELGVAAIPNEVYAITGLKLKAQSPLQPLINMELANGYEGYLPPPEQYVFGGYSTWPTLWDSSAPHLEMQAEPKIVHAVLGLLEQVSGEPPRKIMDHNGPYANAVLHSEPTAYWRLEEFSGSDAKDATGHGNVATYESGIAFYLPGPDSEAFSGSGIINRAPHLAGGKLHALLKDVGQNYSIEAWFWNGLPSDARDETGWIFSRGTDRGRSDALGIGGTNGSPGRLIYTDGTKRVAGSTPVLLKGWNHVVFSRQGERIKVYLNGSTVPDISAVEKSRSAFPAGDFLFGARSGNANTLEGKLDEVAIYDRALAPLEISDHFRVSGMGGHP